MAKQVKKTTSKNLKLTILKSISENNKLPENISKARCSYHLKSFLIGKLVRKVGYGTWEITDLGKRVIDLEQVKNYNLVTTFKPSNLKLLKKTKIRGHGFMWVLKLPARAWLSPKQRLKILKDGVETGNKTIKATIKGHKVHFCARSIIIYFNPNESYVGQSAKDSYKLALYEFEKLITLFEKIYAVSLRINKRYKFKVARQHYGDLNNEFAVHYKQHNKSLRVFDEGKVWLTLDFSSKQYIEAETVDPERAKYDMDAIITPTMNTLRHDPLLLQRLQKENQELKELILDMQQSIKLIASNMK